MATMGKFHFWLLPNLTAECGFFESFIPAYEYTVKEAESIEERRGSETASADVGEIETTAEPGKTKSEEDNEDSEKENGDWVKVKKNDADGPS